MIQWASKQTLHQYTLGGNQGGGGGGQEPGVGPESRLMGLGPGARPRYVMAQYKSQLYELVIYYNHRIASTNLNPGSILRSPQAVPHPSTNARKLQKYCQHLEESASGPPPQY